MSVSDNDVRLELYRFFVREGRPPVAAEVAGELNATPAEIEAAYGRLADAHVIVLAPGTPYIWMANPLSALPTPFSVQAQGRQFWGVCIWDSLGILAMLDADGSVTTRCPDCAEPLQLEVTDGRITGEGLVHFAVPAAHWWDDIGFN